MKLGVSFIQKAINMGGCGRNNYNMCGWRYDT